MVKFIESELVLLKKEIDEMWTLVYNQLDRAGRCRAYAGPGTGPAGIGARTSRQCFRTENRQRRGGHNRLYNPVAIDLRFVLAMFKINTDLERLGDFAEGIARFVVAARNRHWIVSWSSNCVSKRC